MIVAVAAHLACVRTQDLGLVGCAPDAACDAQGAPPDAPARCTGATETVDCYDGPPLTLAVGRCRAGRRRCDPLRGLFGGACEGESLPAAVELCGNGTDDDCDGAVDEDCDGVRFTDVAVGDRTSCVLSRDGSARRLACWGDGSWGLFGDDRSVRVRPAPVTAPPGVSALAMGAAHLCALALERVWCVGRNDSGALGDGGLDDRRTFTPIADLDGVVGLTAGRFHTCAFTRAEVWCWGADAAMQTGATSALTACARGGSRGCVVRPERVALPAAPRAVRAGFEHTCALLEGGDVWCWGQPAAYDGASSSPERVVVGATALVVGGTATCWSADGATCAGRLGGLDPLPGPDVARFAGGQRWCAVVGDDQLRCTNDAWWPSPDVEGALAQPLAVVDVIEGEGTIGGVAVGISHACALWGGHAVRCWGDDNSRGQLGVGSTVVWSAPGAAVAW